VLIVVSSIGLLKVALTAWLRGTPVAPFRGIVEITVGGTVSRAAPVVNVHTKSAAIAVPDRFVTPVVTVAVYKVRGVRLLVGVRVTILFTALKVTAPPTGVVPGPVRVNVEAVIVAGFIASSNIAVIAVLSATPVALLRGVTAVTVGGVMPEA
jgi:hypothetical protein